MTEPVDWRADGVPRSARFNDIYHSEAGALAQARHVFLAGCDLPAAWAGQPQWRILETGFGFGLNFLATWQAWRADACQPRLLHFVSIEAHPVARADLLRAASAYAELAPLAELLAAQCHGLLPGFHRLVFDEGRVLLTLCIGDVQPMLRAQHFDADSIFLDGFSPANNPVMWSPETLKTVARFTRRGTQLATWTVARPVRDALALHGFVVQKVPGLTPKRDALRATFSPAWEPRRRAPARTAATPAGHCAVVGAGLAGAAVAASLARRGWQVTVFDAAAHPAAGASGLPVGLLAPHVSPDDALLSRLTRAGARATWQQLEALLEAGVDWRATGVLERRAEGDLRMPPSWSPDGPNESWHASLEQLRAAKLPADTCALWHARAGWVRPTALVRAWLARPGIQFVGDCRIVRIAAWSHGWALYDAQGVLRAEADRVVIAAGFESGALAPALPLQPVSGQVMWGRMNDSLALPAVPVSGDGQLITSVPASGGAFWLAGATFERDSIEFVPQASATEANRQRLMRLHPQAATALQPAFAGNLVQSWVGVRCASGDRRPLVGPIAAGTAAEAGPWLCSAMGSRGLTFAALCAELLAARWHAEPLQLPASLAKALDTARCWPASAP